jgi:hypothetical protein
MSQLAERLAQPPEDLERLVSYSALAPRAAAWRSTGASLLDELGAGQVGHGR